MDTSVLEQQRAIVLQRLYHHHQSDENAPANLNSEINFGNNYQQILLSHLQQPVNTDHHQSLHYPESKPDHQRSHSAVCNSNNSFMTGAIMSKTDNPQCDTNLVNREMDDGSCFIKKRKAEFDMEEEDKRLAEEIGEEKSEIMAKCERETSTNGCSKSSSKVSESQKTDYIHVRARRGQATDSHSLAERARREKISKKMKCLQDLVPGCDKVSGKAGMLDEIINYVQSLQKQVEFLSMKLGALNPRLDLSMDSFFAKEIPAYIAQLEAANSACFQYNPMQQGTTDHTALIDQFQMLPQKPGTTSIPVSEAFIPSHEGNMELIAAITTAFWMGSRLDKPIQCWISLVKEDFSVTKTDSTDEHGNTLHSYHNRRQGTKNYSTDSSSNWDFQDCKTESLKFWGNQSADHNSFDMEYNLNMEHINLFLSPYV